MDTKRIKEVAERLSNSVVGENSQVRVALITSALVTLINEQKEEKNIEFNLPVIKSLPTAEEIEKEFPTKWRAFETRSQQEIRERNIYRLQGIDWLLKRVVGNV